MSRRELSRRIARLERRHQIGWIDVEREVHLYYQQMPLPGADPSTPPEAPVLAARFPFTQRIPRMLR